MKWILLLLLTPVVCFSQHKKRIDVQHFESKPVELSLDPKYDLFQMRYDVLRQTKQVTVNDSVTKTEPEAYEICGFDIGRFLFADLNNNLSVRIDKLLDLNTNSEFEVAVQYLPFRERSKSQYQFKDGVYSHKYGKKEEFRPDFKVQHKGKAIEVFSRRKFLYNLVENDEGLFRSNKRRLESRILKQADNFYSTSENPKRGSRYYIHEGKIIIDRSYILVPNSENNAIEVYYWTRKKELKQPIYTIRYNKNEIIVYDKKQRGYYIHYSPTNVEVYERGKKVITYSKIL